MNRRFDFSNEVPKSKSEKRFIASNRGIRTIFRLIQIFERCKNRNRIDGDWDGLFDDLENILDEEFEEDLEEYYGEGGFNQATEEVIKKLREKKEKYESLVTDLREL